MELFKSIIMGRVRLQTIVIVATRTSTNNTIHSPKEVTPLSKNLEV
jgi:hypothetical protein